MNTLKSSPVIHANQHQAQAKAALREAEPQMAKGVTKGLVHRNTMARRMSRLSARIKGMQG